MLIGAKAFLRGVRDHDWPLHEYIRELLRNDLDLILLVKLKQNCSASASLAGAEVNFLYHVDNAQSDKHGRDMLAPTVILLAGCERSEQAAV